MPKPPDCASEQSEYNQETEGKLPSTAPFTRWAAALQPQRPSLIPATHSTGSALMRPAPSKGAAGYAPTPRHRTQPATSRRLFIRFLQERTPNLPQTPMRATDARPKT